jgi:hypothetical protein
MLPTLPALGSDKVWLCRYGWQMERTVVVNEALAELSQRLVIPCDVIAVHRQDGLRVGGRERKWASLRYGAFLLAYAPFEAFLNNVTEYRTNKGRTLSVSADRFRAAVLERWGIENVTSNWGARTRPAPESRWGRARWVLIRGHRIDQYLMDMKSLRDLLGHGSDPTMVTNKSKTLWPLVNGRFSMRIMGVEGFIQAVEDIASCTAIAIAGASAKNYPLGRSRSSRA